MFIRYVEGNECIKASYKLPPFLPRAITRALERETRHRKGEKSITLHVTDVSAMCLRRQAYYIIDEFNKTPPEEYLSSIINFLYGTMGHFAIERYADEEIVENDIMHAIRENGTNVIIMGRYDIFELTFTVNKYGEEGFWLWDIKTTTQYALSTFRSLRKAYFNRKFVLVDTDNKLYPPFKSAVRQIKYYASILRKHSVPVVRASLLYIAKPSIPILAKPLLQETDEGWIFSVDNLYIYTVEMNNVIAERSMEEFEARARALARAILKNDPGSLPPSERPKITCRDCPYYSRCKFDGKPEKKLP